jgi:hypothetical protein
MEKQTLEDSVMNVERVNKKDSGNEQLVEREAIENSPFTIITVDEQSFGVMGEFRVTEKYTWKDDVRKELEKITWNRIVQVFMILNKLTKDESFMNEVQKKENRKKIEEELITKKTNKK